MRRVSTIIVCAMILQAVCASQAFAWWDGVEHASGPGPFYGWDIQLRLFCVVQPEGQRAEVRTSGPVGAILSVCRIAKDNRDRKAGKERERVMFDLGARFLRTKKYEDQVERGEIPDFANGNRIHLTTLEPAVMFPVVDKGLFRLDYGFGAGVYWLSSEGFEPDNGTFLEPIRFDFRLRLPSSWKVDAAIARFGWLNFPAGFNFQDFGGAPGHDGRVSSDWVKSIALFVDLTEAAAIWTDKLKR
jgi:hypothetical protein